MEMKRISAIGEEGSPKEDRVVLLSDGVFAIAMTLLILDVKLPEGIKGTFVDALKALFPNFISYVISFAVIGAYWLSHRRLINYLAHIDLPFVQLNLLLLFFITTLPIPTTFVFQKEYSDRLHIATIIYTLCLAASGFILAALWLYATWKHRLVDSELEQDTINHFLVVLLIAPVIFLLSLLILLFPVDSSYVYFSWLVIYVAFLLLKRVRTRLFPNLAKSSSQK